MLGSVGNVVTGDDIGTDAAGAAAMGNFRGIVINGGNNLIGGTAVADRNVVSGNSGFTFVSSSKVPVGQYVTATATDPAGNTSEFAAGIQVSGLPPTPYAPVLDTSSDSGVSPTDGITNITSPLVDVNVYGITNYGDYTPHLLVDGAEAGSLRPNTYLVQLTNLSEGNHTLAAYLTNRFGDVGSTSAVTTITIDATPPPAPIVLGIDPASDSGASNHDNITNVLNPVFDLNYSDAGVYFLQSDGAPVGEVFVRTPGAGQLATDGLGFAWNGDVSTYQGTSQVVADFTGDGKPDFLATRYNSTYRENVALLYVGNGDGTFQLPAPSPSCC